MGTYKDSGIEWIGEIPNEWDVSKIKYTSTLHGRIGWQGLTSEEYIEEGPYLITGTDFLKGEIDWDSCVHISEERWAQADKIQIKEGDLLITKDGTVGKTAIVTNLNNKASLNSGVLLINLKTHSKKYLYWLLNSKVFWEWFDITNSGNSTILHLYQKDFDNFSFPIPPLQEQAAIADFLDKKSEEIDAISAKITHQIQTLKDYRQSLITETVTKGLDKTVSYKDSGIEWIGKIPEGWDVSKIKYEIHSIGSGTTPDSDVQDYYDGDNYWIQSGDLYNTKIVRKTEKNITDFAVNSFSALKLYKAPFIVIAMYGASIGNLAISTIDAYTNQACCVLQDENFNTTYLFYYLSASKQPLINEALGGTQPNISQVVIKNFILLLPPLVEQATIADYLDDKTAKIDCIIAKKEQQLEIIKEHRKSLIYEYVTGKKRVKEYQEDGN